MTTYRIGTSFFKSENEAEIQRALTKLQGSQDAKVRPLCMCKPPGVEMYVAKVSGKYMIKRMPDTGSTHSFTCESYEPPPGSSGRGEVMGQAIQEDLKEGTTTLKLAFSMSKQGGREAPTPGDGEADSVKTDGKKLSLRGLLHYLWEEAGFNKWYPAMAGKRNYSVIRYYLLQAANNKITKGAMIEDRLYIPEPFSLAEKEEISKRRVSLFMKAALPVKGAKPLLVCIGEVAEFGPARYGQQMTFRHAKDRPFMLNDDIFRRLRKRFSKEFELWDSDEGNRIHLMAIATFSVGPTGTPSVEEIALMVTNENWIPVDNAADFALVKIMCDSERSFFKGMRYNLSSNAPLACVTAIDTAPDPTAMYILPVAASEDYVKALNKLIEENKMPHWMWRAGEEDLPVLPPRARQ
ncbi:DUF1173 domain-containing protein [Herbaspirillum huttiense]|uniref:DUF1173 domain-containing protein n=1 Tax=Herbaspirillum huttiense TaxID=863372 RepID=UPI002176A739|nr:DUF1173 domain-containing protein [Herbaspirillum huttiense]UWE19402.1 DUF1173 domain-containing protein [Herbaspirillum huttiense]